MKISYKKIGEYYRVEVKCNKCTYLFISYFKEKPKYKDIHKCFCWRNK